MRLLRLKGLKTTLAAKYTELIIKALGLSFYTVVYIGLEIKAFGLSF